MDNDSNLTSMIKHFLEDGLLICNKQRPGWWWCEFLAESDAILWENGDTNFTRARFDLVLTVPREKITLHKSALQPQAMYN